MNPIDFADLAIKLYGRKRWKRELAKALGTNASTIHRLGQREEIPGVYEVALKGLLQHKRAQHILDRDARAKERKLHPKPRKRVLVPPTPKEKTDGPTDTRNSVLECDARRNGSTDTAGSEPVAVRTVDEHLAEGSRGDEPTIQGDAGPLCEGHDQPASGHDQGNASGEDSLNARQDS